MQSTGLFDPQPYQEILTHGARDWHYFQVTQVPSVEGWLVCG
jgi:hypothetical protein